MRFDSPENIKFFIENAASKTTKEWMEHFGCQRDTIGAWKKKYDVRVKAQNPLPMSEGAKQKISEKRKQWLKNNPDRHPWKNRDKFKSEPCEKAKEFLRQLGVSFVSEFSPQISGRYFSVDIALPDKMIALEINGNQHYERNGQLKPYYQERHDLLTSHGWNVFEIHYSACFNLNKWAEFVKQLVEAPTVKEFDYFNYQPRPKNTRRNLCSCGQEKYHTAMRCKSCYSLHPRKEVGNYKRRVKKKTGIPAPIPTENSHLEGGGDMHFTTGTNKINKHLICACGERKQKKSKHCWKCNGGGKGNWPPIEEFKKLLWEIPTQKLQKLIGVSDVAIGKFCKRHGISKPPRGYWAKKLFNKL